MSQKIITRPQREEIVAPKVDFYFEGQTGTIIPVENLENRTELRFSSSVAFVGKENTFSIVAFILIDNALIFTKKSNR